MSLCCYLAMTEGEMSSCNALPNHMAYMACHFSPYGTGLMNFPQTLPPDSMLILNDRIPIRHHKAEAVAETLLPICKRFSPRGVLLDFEISGCERAAEIARHLAEALPCPVGVSENYAEGLSCPVFLSPPLHIPLEEAAKKWSGRPIWLEAALQQAQLVIDTEKCTPVPCKSCPEGAYFSDEALCCDYTFSLSPNRATFTLRRDKEALQKFLAQGEKLGAELAVGLYQQLGYP